MPSNTNVRTTPRPRRVTPGLTIITLRTLAVVTFTVTSIGAASLGQQASTEVWPFAATLLAVTLTIAAAVVKSQPRLFFARI